MIFLDFFLRFEWVSMWLGMSDQRKKTVIKLTPGKRV